MDELTQRELENLIKENPRCGEYYGRLGDYLEDSNPGQAYLCYENAFYFDKKEEYREKMAKISGKANVPKVSIVILNYNMKEMTRECIDSIIETTPESAREIILVDNGSDDGSVEFFCGYKGVVLWANEKNEGFPKGCNQGIGEASYGTDVLLLNNDIVMCENTLFWLRMGLYADERHGLAGCVTNHISNEQTVVEDGQDLTFYREFARKNNVPMNNPYEYRLFLVGYAFLIKNCVMKEIGLLDEVFGMGNYEDNDYCMRALIQGYQCIVVHNSFIVHWGSKSFSKREDFGKLLTQNHKILEGRYGIDTDSELNDKCGIASYNDIEMNTGKPQILYLNCELCAPLLKLKYLHPETEIEAWGCENKVARISSKLSCINVSYYENISDINAGNNYYDVVYVRLTPQDKENAGKYIQMADRYINDNGKIILIVENIRHYIHWINLIMRGKVNLDIRRDSLCLQDVMDCVDNAGYNSYRWRFDSVAPTDRKELELVNSIAEVLGENNKDIFVKRYIIELAKK